MAAIVMAAAAMRTSQRESGCLEFMVQSPMASADGYRTVFLLIRRGSGKGYTRSRFLPQEPDTKKSVA
jgi:hypothetical protein